MPRMSRRNARGSLSPPEGTADVPIASRALRGRVLAAVRADPGRRSPLPRLSGRLARARTVAPSALLAISASAAVAWLVVVLASPADPARYPGTVVAAERGASAILRHAGDEAELRVAGLTPTAPSRAYQLWFLHGTEPPRPTDVLFTVSRAGTATVAVPGDLRGVRELLVTSEPRGGSARPSGPPALSVALPAAT
jgi:hypothetical protein